MKISRKRLRKIVMEAVGYTPSNPMLYGAGQSIEADVTELANRWADSARAFFDDNPDAFHDGDQAFWERQVEAATLDIIDRVTDVINDVEDMLHDGAYAGYAAAPSVD